MNDDDEAGSLDALVDVADVVGLESARRCMNVMKRLMERDEDTDEVAKRDLDSAGERTVLLRRIDDEFRLQRTKKQTNK